jgi:hypothetical protein
VRIVLLLAAFAVVSCAAAAAAQRPATVSPDGTTRFSWRTAGGSASIAADGVPLVVKRGETTHVLVPWMLEWPDFLSWCGNRLVVAAGGDRYTTHAKRLVVAVPPYRRVRPLTKGPALSWVSPVCAPDGRSVVASAGRSWTERRFGQERRSLWLLDLAGRPARRLTLAPPRRSDEAPCFSGDSATLYFVRSGPVSAAGKAAGRLYALDLAALKLRPLERLAPVTNVFGHYAWPRPATPRCDG